MAKRIKKNKFIVFVVVGRLGKGLVISKVDPIIMSKKVKKVYVFSQDKCINIDGAVNIIIPDYIKNFKIRFFRKIIRQIFEPYQLLKYALKCKPDYINGVFTLPKGLNSVLVSKCVSCKSIVSVIGGIREILTYNKPTWFWKNVNLCILRSCTIVTTKGTKVSEYLIQNGIKKDKIFILNGSINTKVYRYNNNIKKDIDLLFVGTFSKLKGPDRVLQIVLNLIAEFPSIKVSFLGTGPLFEEIKNNINKLNLEESVFLHGYVENPVHFYQRSKILLLPSQSEGLSTAMLEVMACRCVPIVSNVGNMTDAAFHNENAFVIKNYLDIDKFTKYTRELLIDSEKREMLSLQGEKLINIKYSIRVQSEIFDKIIKYKTIN